ncbi:hypothetical protein OIU77_031563 [Salix suchowensis]|uniref:Uncharacterized protein n=1 Tax=Salix suchowensis TaxID=1278906 RepID=A0ABQ9BJI5_9ROSI|nr:hypothetical protein OIU77_031563 [Salix suchowensis]
MAPRKKAEETKTKPSTTPATRRSARMTRSAAKRLNARLTELPTDAGKKRKQGKAEESKKKVKTEAVTATSSESQPEVNTLEEEEDEDEDEADEEDAKEESTFTGDGVNKTIVIEHCWQEYNDLVSVRGLEIFVFMFNQSWPFLGVLINKKQEYCLCIVNSIWLPRKERIEQKMED